MSLQKLRKTTCNEISRNPSPWRAVLYNRFFTCLDVYLLPYFIAELKEIKIKVPTTIKCRNLNSSILVLLVISLARSQHSCKNEQS